MAAYGENLMATHSAPHGPGTWPSAAVHRSMDEHGPGERNVAEPVVATGDA